MPVGPTNRRAFIVGIGSAAAWPLAARAQQAMPVIGFLSPTSLQCSQTAYADSSEA